MVDIGINRDFQIVQKGRFSVPEVFFTAISDLPLSLWILQRRRSLLV